MTAQYPALPGLSSLSRWLTWITVHTPRSGPVIKTVREGMCAISLALALSSSSPFFSLLLLSPLLDPHCHFPLPLHPSLFISLSFFLFLFGSSFPSPTWTCLLVTSSTFSRLHSLSRQCHRRRRPPTPSQSSPLCVSSSLSIPASPCVESGAA